MEPVGGETPQPESEEPSISQDESSQSYKDDGAIENSSDGDYGSPPSPKNKKIRKAKRPAPARRRRGLVGKAQTKPSAKTMLTPTMSVAEHDRLIDGVCDDFRSLVSPYLRSWPLHMGDLCEDICKAMYYRTTSEAMTMDAYEYVLRHSKEICNKSHYNPTMRQRVLTIESSLQAMGEAAKRLESGIREFRETLELIAGHELSCKKTLQGQ